MVLAALLVKQHAIRDTRPRALSTGKTVSVSICCTAREWEAPPIPLCCLRCCWSTKNCAIEWHRSALQVESGCLFWPGRYHRNHGCLRVCRHCHCLEGREQRDLRREINSKQYCARYRIQYHIRGSFRHHIQYQSFFFNITMKNNDIGYNTGGHSKTTFFLAGYWSSKLWNQRKLWDWYSNTTLFHHLLLILRTQNLDCSNSLHTQHRSSLPSKEIHSNTQQ